MADDLLPLFRWFNDLDAARLDTGYRPVDWASHRAWFESIGKDPSKILFALRQIGEAGLLGYVTIAHINGIHRSAEIGVRIGEEKNRGRGFGSEGLRLALDFCWRHLNLQRVSLNAFKHNERALRTFAKVGFKKEGVLRRAAYIDGSWVDLVVMAALRPRPNGPSPAARGPS